jgi:hypothetical protein
MINKPRRRQTGGTVKATGMVPGTRRLVGVGGFQTQLKQQAIKNRQIAEGYQKEGNAQMAAFWLAQAKACDQAAQKKARPGDRVTDGVAAFYQRLRANSPRQRRLRALQELKVARITETVRSLMGGLMLVAIFILFSIS